MGHSEESVHFTLLPTAKNDYINKSVERRVDAMQIVIDTVRVLRERKAIAVKVPRF